jgi:hypothetical protein
MFPWIYQEIYDHASYFSAKVDIQTRLFSLNKEAKETFDSLLQKIDNDNRSETMNYLLGAIFPL